MRSPDRAWAGPSTTYRHLRDTRRWTVSEVLAAQVVVHGAKVFLRTTDGAELTYTAAQDQAARMGAFLHRLGIAGGDTVAVLLPNSLDFVRIWLGAAHIGAAAELNTWKPPARVYLHGAAALALPPEQVALVAVHAWDCHAAKRAGLMAGWAARLEGRYGEIFAPADVMGADLVEVAQRLVALDQD